MTPVTPTTLHENAKLVVFGKNQAADYVPLPASVDPQGLVMCEFEPTADELDKLRCGGRIRLWLANTGVERGVPLTPITIEATDPITATKES